MQESIATTMQIAAPEKPVGLAALAILFRTLNEEGVRYCHWKSNVRLEAALNGETDLDLLVAREDSDSFRRILSEQGIKPLIAAPGKHYPGLENYLGYDSESGNLFHLHVHYQLVLGERFVKNYRLPLEAHFLKAVRLRHGVFIPEAELELVLFCIRMLLKYRDRDVIKDVFSIRTPGLSGAVLQEFEWLWAQTTLPQVRETLETLEDLLPADIVLDFLRIVTSAPRDGYRLWRLRQDLRRALSVYQRYSGLRASLLYFRELWRRRKSFLRFGSNRKMTFSNGGQALAIIGADGAGKSTMCQVLTDWLGWKVDIHFFYLGSTQPAWRSDFLYLIFRMARRTHRDCSRLLGEGNLAVRILVAIRQALRYTHHLSVGYDRYRRFRASREMVAAGSLVVFDRYPLAALLDGPKIELLAGGETPGLAQLFSRWERAIYQKIGPPDHYFLLDVTSEVSLQRKPDHDRATIEAKQRLLRDLAEEDLLNLARLDADLPFQRVVNALKRTVWQRL